ncbi:phytoene desaturase family protein [Gordonia sp. HY002]|uniref:phytoene desaturase family protein n=1 Tax=Gordonia zhenghanii TaxID=2911516 RepID=UPI001EF009F6|nr:phytoene desaturase family protein [Gordonia zhenghanii]MCF8570790.1 phytoene desaturase family protein [Gordonia zhenghanii]MCF8603775.1 phytoene desaturase family protein [Gordonia zhenghanii]
MATRAPRVAVIGAGLSGLAAAAHLRANGAEVTVFEAEDSPGGLVRTETVGGHRFDTGATVLTMPSLIVDALGALGVDADEANRRLALRPVDPGYVLNYADGTSLAVPHDAAAIPAAVASVFGEQAGDGVADLLHWLRRVYDAEFDTFIDRNFDGLADLTDARTRRSAAELVRLRTLGGLTGAIARFIADERLQRAFTFQALYAGVPPRRARAIYAIIPDMDIGRGVFAPDGGMERVGRVLADALTDSGADIEYQTPITSIRRDPHGRVSGVAVGDSVVDVDAVVATLERDGVAQLTGERPRRRLRYSPSAVVVHGLLPAGTTNTWRAGHHTLDFGTAWTQTFTEITGKRGRLMSDGSFLITRSAVGDPSTFVADGFESVSVLAPAPNLDSADLDWDRIAEPYVEEVVGTLASRGYPGIDGMRVMRIDHPKTWSQAGLPAGTPFSAAHTASQTGPLRTANVWPTSPNLVLAGSATVPGVGIPPVLVSGGLAAARVTELLRGGDGGR